MQELNDARDNESKQQQTIANQKTTINTLKGITAGAVIIIIAILIKPTKAFEIIEELINNSTDD